MTAKEKAVELYNSYFDLGRDFTRGVSMREFAKECALVAVKEAMKDYESTSMWYFSKVKRLPMSFWLEVKQEIEKL